MLTVNTKLSEHQNAGGVASEYLDDSLLQDYHQFHEIERLKNISDRERRFLEDSHSYWTEDTGQKSQIFLLFTAWNVFSNKIKTTHNICSV